MIALGYKLKKNKKKQRNVLHETKSNPTKYRVNVNIHNNKSFEKPNDL